ncbi:MAG TPA: HAMP domain-containing sensor histidine kinase [Streptosporangiaceae bacterium]|nr:HAMP domain-containing sensor histidine kinase [Streptosporangiaceae bacterium]
MRFSGLRTTGRGRLSLRSRLLAGLITITALFLIVMGVVTTIVLGNSEQDQFDTDLGLTVKESLSEIANLPNGYAAAYINVPSRSTGILSGASATASQLQSLLENLLDNGEASSYFAQNPRGTLFTISQPDDPALTAIWRPITVKKRGHSLLPTGTNILVVARPDSAVGSEVRGLILAELITGAILLTLLALGGRWLIGRGLAPLDRMASTADMITSRGDLTARMPDPGDHAEAGRLAAAINTMLDRIQQAFRARWASEQKVRQFAADASHELRTPLTTIRGYAELYRQGALGPDRLPNAMRRIEQEAERMSSLVAELLELARLDRHSSLDLTETDLAGLVRDAVADAQAVEPERPVNARTPPSLVVVADEPRIRQVLANLLGNVREHTPADTPVAVRLSAAGQGALLEVTDAGPGMNSEAAARAFDRFYRGGHNGSDGHGSGLGLSIVQAIAAAHGGHAMLKSAEGAGTTVQVWIPFHPPTHPSTLQGEPGPDPTYN